MSCIWANIRLLLATDPLSDIPVAFALVDKNDQDHMGRFLGNLKKHGLEPTVMITDGSSLYPTLLKALWPDAEHQLCVFHVLQDVNKASLKAVLRLRRGLSRRGKGGRKRQRGRPRKARASRRQQHRKQKEQAHFIFKRRNLIVKRRDGLTEQEQKDLKTMLEYPPRAANAAGLRRCAAAFVFHRAVRGASARALAAFAKQRDVFGSARIEEGA
jgi:hypothetical protein